MTDDETSKIKHELWKWGNAFYFCQCRQEEIKKLKQMIQDVRQIGSPIITGMPKGTDVSDVTQSAAVKIVDSYEATINKLTDEICRRMEHKNRLDDIVSGLPHEQRQVLELRYIKGYGWNYIHLQMHFSRRQCFNVHDAAIEKIALFCTKFDLYFKQDVVS